MRAPHSYPVCLWSRCGMEPGAGLMMWSPDSAISRESGELGRGQWLASTCLILSCSNVHQTGTRYSRSVSQWCPVPALRTRKPSNCFPFWPLEVNPFFATWQELNLTRMYYITTRHIILKPLDLRKKYPTKKKTSLIFLQEQVNFTILTLWVNKGAIWPSVE